MPRAVTFSRHDGPEVLELVQLDDGAGEFTVGDEVVGHLPRGAQADHVGSPADVLAPKPTGISCEAAAPLAAAGSLAARLARLRGASGVGTTGPRDADFLRSLGVVPVQHGPGLAVARHGVRSRAQEDVFTPQLVAEPAELDAKGRLAVPISTVHPPEQVQEAYRQVRQRPPRGKIVLSLVPPDERPAPATALRA
ncbi:zinc-binding dehydrogenase [Streptomyces sp. NPDC059272]|uniref:zinc-binding dehydrogenase n=1 Tax=Streptomyces sp. NPDC059272 TaxID=3346800 RepID=UPI0036C4E5A1